MSLDAFTSSNRRASSLDPLFRYFLTVAVSL
jgi:hypothetical protein